MLDEARRRHGRGTDVVVGAYSVHGDAARALHGLEVVGAKRSSPREQRLDPEAVLARNPQVVCVDDLAAPDVNGEPCFGSVPRLLAAGITVLATLHLLSTESARAAFADLVPPGDGRVVDDGFVAGIQELELVDVPPDDLLERLRHEKILTPARLAQAMQRELRPDVLGALREFAFRLVAEHTDRDLLGYLQERRMGSRWEVRGRIVLCLPPSAGMEERIREAERYAAIQDAKLTVATVLTREPEAGEKAALASYRDEVRRHGGDFVELRGRSVGMALVKLIEESRATEVILGRRHSRWTPWDTTSQVIRSLAGIDVHVLRRPSK